MKYLVWAHDPSETGGWHIIGSDDTRDGAVAKAKKFHARELKNIEEEYGVPLCYDKVMVTEEPTFKLGLPDHILKREECSSCHGFPGEGEECSVCKGRGWVDKENAPNKRSVK